MTKTRLEAFSDGFFAIIITVMVLELKVPHGASFAALVPVAPVLVSYVISFIYVGIYWNNHHHMLHASRHVDGRVLWANLHLLFWLSLVPFATGWIGENPTESVPTALYGVVLLFSGVAWLFVQEALLKVNGRDSPLGLAIGRDLKGKASAVIYTAAVALAFVRPWIADALYVGVAMIWLVPDRRIERRLREEG
jgi:uncharacterized membrane protein